ncbi:MAG TPA: hypothetical protein VFU94_11740 [Conexibacter sp.]|nr:hypothetical protein [Conexibacter sp.]
MPEPATPATDASRLGAAFARALAAKDFARAAALLHPDVDFGALTPRRAWEAHTPEQVAAEVLSVWFDDDCELDELVRVERETFRDRERVAYQLRGRGPDGPFLMEQQAYLTARDGRIGWMRVLCSGKRPLG